MIVPLRLTLVTIALAAATACGPRQVEVRTAPPPVDTTAAPSVQLTNNLSQAVNVYVNVSGGSTAGANQWKLRFWSSGTKFVVSSSSLGGFVYAPSAVLTVSAGTVAGSVYGGAVTVSGNSHVTRTIDATPPVVTITSPLDHETVVDLSQVAVHGTVIDPETPITSFQVNGADVVVASDGSFTVTLNLSAASPALISATATNAAGLSATSAITVQ